MIIQLAFGDAPAPAHLLSEQDVVFVERRVVVRVRSCATGQGWEMLDSVHRTIVAYPRPYQLQRGECYARRAQLTESAKHAALHALTNRKRTFA